MTRESKRWGRWLIALSTGGLLACAPSPKTVANVTTGITGCPAESLAVFNYVKATRTWSASCGEKLYVCSDGRGPARCTEQQADTIDQELQIRAKALQLLPAHRRASFVDTDISQGDWRTFAVRIATIKAMSDQQLSDVDPQLVYGEGTADLDKVLGECMQQGKLNIAVGQRGELTSPVTTGALPSPCITAILARPELAPLKQHPKQDFVLLSGVFGIQPIERPTLAAAPAEVASAQAASDAPAASEPAPAASSELDTAVRQWLDKQSANILACTGKDRSALLVNVSAEGKPEVSIRGAAAGAPEEGCVRSALSAPPTLPAGPAQILHVVKSGS